MEGAKWDMDGMQIVESEIGKLFYDMPIIHFIPVMNKPWGIIEDQQDEQGNPLPDLLRDVKKFDFKGRDYQSKDELLLGYEIDEDELDEEGNKIIDSTGKQVKKRKTDYNIFETPTYKTSARKGTLSTTGHSTNYIMAIDCPIPDGEEPDTYVKKGVAMLTTLDDE